MFHVTILNPRHQRSFLYPSFLAFLLFIYFTNPAQATTLGLAAVALTDNPSYPTYPNNMTSSQISSGLSAPFAAVALLGKPGAIALLITLFMAVTSSSSSELIAVSSIMTFDVYKMYIRPFASPEELIKVAHVMICVFGLVMATFACIWNAIGIDLGWLFLVMGLLIGGAVFPAAFAVTWKKQSKYGAISGAVGGLCAGLTAWLVEAKVYYGELTVTTTGASYPTLAGNMAAVLTGLILTVVVSYIKPDDFDWAITRGINKVTEAATPATDRESLEQNQVEASDPEKKTSSAPHTSIVSNLAPHSTLPTILHEDAEELEDQAIMEDPTRLKGAFRFACISATILTLLMDFIIPLPMFLSHYIFSKGFFTGWVVVSFIWVFFALVTCALLPIWEAMGFFRDFWKEVWEGRKVRKGSV